MNNDFDYTKPLKAFAKCADPKGLTNREMTSAGFKVYNKVAQIDKPFMLPEYDEGYGHIMMFLGDIFSYTTGRVKGHRVSLDNGIDCVLMNFNEGTVTIHVKVI